eukprot:7133834-Prymnesium_polylepis.1
MIPRSPPPSPRLLPRLPTPPARGAVPQAAPRPRLKPQCRGERHGRRPSPDGLKATAMQCHALEARFRLMQRRDQ